MPLSAYLQMTIKTALIIGQAPEMKIVVYLKNMPAQISSSLRALLLREQEYCQSE